MISRAQFAELHKSAIVAQHCPLVPEVLQFNSENLIKAEVLSHPLTKKFQPHHQK